MKLMHAGREMRSAGQYAFCLKHCLVVQLLGQNKNACQGILVPFLINKDIV